MESATDASYDRRREQVRKAQKFVSCPPNTNPRDLTILLTGHIASERLRT
jgi:hypothetical protein